MATHKQTGVTINRGDRIEVTAKGVTLTGIVTYADCDFFRDNPDWMVEFRSEDGKPHYWKQRFDGGTVRVLEHAPID